MRVIYVGPLWEGGTCLQRMQAMQELGHEILPLDTAPACVCKKQKKLFYKILRKIFGPIALIDVNKQIISIITNAKRNQFDVIWIDKGLTIKEKILIQVKNQSPKTIIVHYNPDDPFGALRSGWKTFIKSAPSYDVHFVPREQNLVEYKKIGCKKVIRFYRGYNSHLHSPINITKNFRLKYGGPVGFIGDYEIERAQSMHYLASAGIPVRIWGPNWDRKCRLRHINMKIEGRPLWGDDYVKAICSFDINLHFLRKINRDLQSSRSIEIPACGGFMLAERTNEHFELFEEKKEAEFFSTNDELLEKVRYYLKHEDKRKNIALNGRVRCLKSGYSNHDRIKQMLNIVENLRAKIHIQAVGS